MNATIAEGVRLFDAGEFWHAHEVWEEAWKADDATDRDYFKGLIQLAAVCFHLRKGNRKPIAWLLTRARHHLTVHDDPRWPFDRDSLLELIEELACGNPGDELPKLARCLRS